MKFDIIKSFKGSPDGRHAVQYNAGDKDIELTDSLAEVAIAEKWAKPSKPAVDDKKEAKRLADIKMIEDDIAKLELDLQTASDTQQTGLLAKLGLKPKGTERETIQAEIAIQQDALAALQK